MEDRHDAAETGTMPSSVLWEKCIQQSIIVDISDNDSLSFGDLLDAFTVQVSQEPATFDSQHLRENSELSGSDDEDGEDADNTDSSSSESVVGNSVSKSLLKVSAQPHNCIWKGADDAVDTSDEEQDDLPYDGDLNDQDSNHVPDPGITDRNTSQNKSIPRHSMGTDEHDGLCMQSADVSNTHKCTSKGVICIITPETAGIQRGCSIHKGPEELLPSALDKPRTAVGQATDLLLRHFSPEDLLSSSRLIQAETMPEVSLMESIDETVLSQAERSPLTKAPQAILNCLPGDIEAVRKVKLSTEDFAVLKVAVSEDSERLRNSEGSLCEKSGPEPMQEEDQPKESSGASSTELSKQDTQNYKLPLGRTKSFTELKYGQGQVHYPLPDFSKIAPKVKIPKGNVTGRPVSQSPTIKRAQSSPGILGKSASSCIATVDMISRLLEDSLPPPEVPHIYQETQSGVVHHMKEEHDRLLNEYADAGVLIDHLKPEGQRAMLAHQSHASSDPSLSTNWDIQEEVQVPMDSRVLSSFTPRPTQPTQTGITADGEKSQRRHSSPAQADLQSQSEGEKLTNELKDMTRQVKEKVDKFEICIDTMSMGVEEQQMVFKTMMEAQDQLERNYISKKEEHRALEMQNYMGFATNTGQFDPERQVEGEIFRIGMHLEDIKERIDRNICQSFSPPPSTSTSSPPLWVEPLSTISPHPPLHERLEPSANAILKDHQEDEERFKATRVEGTSEDSPMNGTTDSGISLQCSDDSRETLCFGSEQEEDREESVRVSLNRVFTRFASPVAPDHEWASQRWSAGVEALCGGTQGTGPRHPAPSHIWSQDTGAPTQDFADNPTLSKAQCVRAETDSGLSSSDLSRPVTRLSQPLSHTDSPVLSDDGCSLRGGGSSNSEASHSNLHTAVSMATGPGRPNSIRQHPEKLYGNAPGMRTNDAVQRRPAGLSDSAQLSERGSTEDLATRLPQPVTMGVTPAPDVPCSRICTCHSEVILALQTEVARLKREVQEGLGHLPHLSQKMDYLASRYRLDRRHRHTHRAQHSSGLSRRQNEDSSQQRTEDWISTDMEASRSKGTDYGDSDGTVSIDRSPFPSPSQRRAHSDRRSRDSKQAYTESLESLPLDAPRMGGVSVQRRAGVGLASTRPSQHSAAGDVETICSKREHLPSSSSPHRPAAQLSYGSSSSLPASFKALERQSSRTITSRRRSIQSDSALLPSNVYFQWASHLLPSSTRTEAGEARRRGSRQEEDINKTLDKAMEAALLMKSTTDRIAKSLSADLAKAQASRKLHRLQPLPLNHSNSY